MKQYAREALTIVHHFIPREKTQQIRVIVESLDNGKDVVEISGAVAAVKVARIETLVGQRGVDIQQHVNSNSIEYRHAIIVIESGVEIVHADCVDTQRLHQSGIPQAQRAIAQRIATLAKRIRAAGLICHTDDLETIAGDIVDEIRTLHLYILDGRYEGNGGKD